MGAMLVRALLGAGHPVEEEIWASNRSLEKLDELTFLYPRVCTGSNADLARHCKTLFLCVRPNDTAQVLDELQGILTADHLLITITNVIELEQLATRVPCRLLKVIPSFTQHVRRGVSLLIAGPRATPRDIQYIHWLIGRICRIYQINENQSRAATNVVSCGPGFLAHFCAEWAAAAFHMQPDIPLQQWEELVWDTVRAASELPRAGIDSRELLEEVSTPGGMTYEGLQIMDKVLPTMWADVMRRTSEHEKELRKAVGL